MCNYYRLLFELSKEGTLNNFVCLNYLLIRNIIIKKNRKLHTTGDKIVNRIVEE